MAHSRVIAELSERTWHMSDFLNNTVGGAATLAHAVSARNHDHDAIRRAIGSHRIEVARVARSATLLAR